MEKEAKKLVENCNVDIEMGQNVAYNTSEVDEEEESLGDIVGYWLESKQPSFGVVAARQVINRLITIERPAREG